MTTRHPPHSDALAQPGAPAGAPGSSPHPFSRPPLARTLREALPSRPWVWIVVLGVTLAWDRAVYLHLSAHTDAEEKLLEGRLWYQGLKALGFLPLWLAVAAAFILADYRHADPRRVRHGLRRGVFLALCAVAGGAVTEVLKLVFRRGRPLEHEGFFSFRSFADDPLSTSGFGFPSSHAGTAFGAAFALCVMFPRMTPLLLAAGAGCALTRVLAGAHFASDVYAAMALAYLCVRMLYALDLRNNDGRPMAPGRPSPG